MPPIPNKGPSYLNLGHLAPVDQLWLDSNGDGYPDHLRVKLCPAPNLQQGRVWAGLCNLAARLAMHVTAIPAPITSLSSGPESTCVVVERPVKQYPHAASLSPWGISGWCLHGHSSQAMARVLESLALADICDSGNHRQDIILIHASDESCVLSARGANHPRSLELCANTGQDPVGTANLSPIDLLRFKDSILAAPADDARASKLSLGLELPDRLPAKSGFALVNLVARAAAEATELTLPLAWVGARAFDGPKLKVVVDPGAKSAALKMLTNQQILATGPGTGMAKLLEEAGRLWFDFQGPGNERLSAWLDRFDTVAGIISGAGYQGRLAHQLANHPNEPLPDVPSVRWSRLATACHALGITPPDRTPSPKTISRRLSWAGEVERLLDVAGSAPAGTGPIDCTVFVSKPEAERLSLGHRVKAVLSAKGYEPGVKVFNAYKPGADWLLNDIAPRLPAQASMVRLYFRPFEGQRPHPLEMKSRWVQEIYPAPDLLAQQKGWSIDQVRMDMDPELDAAYRIVAFDGGGRAVFEEHFTPPVSCFSYLVELPEGNSVNPTCAGLVLRQAGQVIWEQFLPSDREVFWRRFQEYWLPEMEKRMVAKLPGMQSGKQMVFWQEVRIEVAIWETDERLGLGDERVSPMEALHEDLYFGLLEFIRVFCRKYSPDNELQMGRIVPVVHSNETAKPWARLSLKPLKHDSDSKTPRPPIHYLQWARGRFGVCVENDAAEFSADARVRLCQVAKAWGFDLSLLSGGQFLYQAPPARRIRVDQPVPPSEPLDQEKIPRADEIGPWIQSLDGWQHLHVWRAGSTLQERGILAVEANAPGGVSIGRARLLKPTLLVNARHHANEVSGTHAALELAWRLGATARGRGMLKKVNVVIVPQENADGVATFEELLPDAPGHKLHAARYNALGVEWYDHYLDDHTPFPEARVKTRLFRRWLPAYLLDLHGVPSHEWEQPFAGYLNPRFREHWIPRTFVYAILPFFGETDHPGAKDAALLAEDFSAAMANQSDIERLNNQLHARYLRYAAAFEPDVFNPDINGNMVIQPTCERIAKTNFGNRLWPLVKSEVITEVLDEVAQGAWLERCGRAHHVVAWAMLERMAKQAPAALIRERSSGSVRFAWLRL